MELLVLSNIQVEQTILAVLQLLIVINALLLSTPHKRVFIQYTLVVIAGAVARWQSMVELVVNINPVGVMELTLVMYSFYLAELMIIIVVAFLVLQELLIGMPINASLLNRHAVFIKM